MLQCTTCKKSYVGQTGRSVATRYREHIRYIKTNKLLSGYAVHILNNRHGYYKPELTLQLLQVCEKGNIMNCWKSLQIQLLQQQQLLIKSKGLTTSTPCIPWRSQCTTPHTTNIWSIHIEQARQQQQNRCIYSHHEHLLLFL